MCNGGRYGWLQSQGRGGDDEGNGEYSQKFLHVLILKYHFIEFIVKLKRIYHAVGRVHIGFRTLCVCRNWKLLHRFFVFQALHMDIIAGIYVSAVKNDFF